MAPKRNAAASTPQGASSATSRSVSPAPPTPMQTKTSVSSGPAVAGLSSSSSTQDIVLHIWKRYLTQTPQRTLLLDAFMAFLVLVGGVQFLYCVLAGNYVCDIYSSPSPSFPFCWLAIYSPPTWDLVFCQKRAKANYFSI